MNGKLGSRIPVRGSDDDFDNLSTTLNTMLDRIEELLGIVSSASNNIAHELRTPLARLTADLDDIEDYLNKTRTEPELTLMIDKARAQADRMRQIFDALLRISRIQSRRDKGEFQSVNLKTVMDEAVGLYAPIAKQKDIMLVLESEAAVPPIKGDANLLFQAITNIIDNALKFTPHGGEAHIDLKADQNCLLFKMTDTGPGVPEEEKEMIFTRFYQTKQNSTTGGFGIGLALLAELVNKLNGLVRVESEINVGSIFYVNLPYELNKHTLHTNSLVKEFDLISIEKCSKEDVKKTTTYPKVLIVDDNLEMIAYLKEIFLDTLECTFAFNGAEALAKIKEHTFDLIISDLRMPLLSGAEFKEALNEIDDQKDIPFIMITAVFYNKLENLKNTLNLNEYIEKPFSKDEILSRVQYILERTLNRKVILNLEPVTQDEVNFDSSSAALVEKIKECILSNLTNPEFNVTMLSKMCGYEQKKLNQILKSKLGLNSVNIILEVRLLKAYEYIVKSKFPTINEVMYAVGINSRSYFSKKFEERFGLKVGELRKKNTYL